MLAMMKVPDYMLNTSRDKYWVNCCSPFHLQLERWLHKDNTYWPETHGLETQEVYLKYIVDGFLNK